MNTPINVVITTPYAKLQVLAKDVSDHAIMRARQLAELLVLIQPEEGPNTMLWLAQQMADELVVAVMGMAGVEQ